jgi:pimeloyl-ACP methyl ester carboxylesterase
MLLRRLFRLAAVLLPSGCVSLDGATIEQFDNRKVEYILASHGAPTVVFENGLGGTFDWWAKVFPEISKKATAFAYNRPGTGKSEAAVTPRDGAHIVDELRGLLKSKGLNPPYVLVGHSLGGLYMQYFARRFPDEVAGLILVDSTHPEQLKGKGSPGSWPCWFRLVMSFATSEAAKEELNAADATGESILALPPFRGKPVIVLSAAKPKPDESGLARDAYEKRKDIAQLFPGSAQIWVNGGHAIPLEQPQAVTAAIRKIMEGAMHAASVRTPLQSFQTAKDSLQAAKGLGKKETLAHCLRLTCNRFRGL